MTTLPFIVELIRILASHLEKKNLLRRPNKVFCHSKFKKYGLYDCLKDR